VSSFVEAGMDCKLAWLGMLISTLEIPPCDAIVHFPKSTADGRVLRAMLEGVYSFGSNSDF
jgi:hypothetical protein